MRTLAVILISLVLPCSAAVVTLSGASGCSYSALAVDAAGNVSATCAGDQPPPPPPAPPPPGPTVPAGCPAAPAGMLTVSGFLDLGVWWAQNQKSGQVVSIPLPSVVTYSKQAVFGENAGAAYTPQPVVLEITISQCAGFIDTDPVNPTAAHPNGQYCNLRSPNGTTNSITWFGKPFSVLNSTASANQYGYCWAPESSGTWYLNARWTYSNCPFGQSLCGFAIQQNLGPY